MKSTLNHQLFVTTAVLLLLLSSQAQAQGPQQVPALFVFGDSLVDTGNNNYLDSIARSNYYPYGIDSPRGPSGRFSNADNFVDLIGNMLGVPAPPAYADPSTNGGRILSGVNYASAAAGILDESGQHYGERYTLSQQVVNFENTLSQFRTIMNNTALSQYLAKSIAILVFGSNDYINNYLMPPLYSSSYNYNPVDYANLLLDHYNRQILALNNLGLRKLFIAGIGPLGCIPSQRGTGEAPPDRCVDHVNQMLGTFNDGLHTLVDQLNANHPRAIFVYGNSYAGVGDILNEPAKFGLSVVDRACCGIGRNQGQITCISFAIPCTNRQDYVFWDAFHPTDAANRILAQRAFSGPPSYTYPVNIQQMALMF